MWDLSSSYTLNGTATATSATTLTDSNATLNADMVGMKLYVANGDNAGLGRTIATINNTTKVITFESSFPDDISTGDTYAINPVPFSLRAWPVQAEELSRFNRWVIMGVSLKARRLSGFTNLSNDKWRVSAYRNSETSLEATEAYADVTINPSDSAEVLNIAGIDIEPYIEQIASGVKFELTDAEFALVLSDSRDVSAS